MKNHSSAVTWSGYVQRRRWIAPVEPLTKYGVGVLVLHEFVGVAGLQLLGGSTDSVY